MKRKTIYLLVSLLVIITVTELYYYVNNRGNFHVWVWNESYSDAQREVIVRVDGEVVLEHLSPINGILPEIVKQSTSLGRHDVFVLDKETGNQLEESFNVFLVRWVVVSVHDDTITVDHHFFPPVIE